MHWLHAHTNVRWRFHLLEPMDLIVAADIIKLQWLCVTSTAPLSSSLLLGGRGLSPGRLRCTTPRSAPPQHSKSRLTLCPPQHRWPWPSCSCPAQQIWCPEVECGSRSRWGQQKPGGTEHLHSPIHLPGQDNNHQDMSQKNVLWLTAEVSRNRPTDANRWTELPRTNTIDTGGAATSQNNFKVPAWQPYTPVCLLTCTHVNLEVRLCGLFPLWPCVRGDDKD